MKHEKGYTLCLIDDFDYFNMLQALFIETKNMTK